MSVIVWSEPTPKQTEQVQKMKQNEVVRMSGFVGQEDGEAGGWGGTHPILVEKHFFVY